MPVHHVAPELALLIGAVLVLLLAAWVPRQRQGTLCAPLALLAVVVAAGLAGWIHATTTPQLTFSGNWALDGIKAWATYVILGTTAAVILLSPVWFAEDRRHGEWYVVLLFSALGALMLAGAADLSELLVATLLSSVTGYTLASFHRASRMSAEAGAKYYFLGALANPLLFLGAVLLFGLAATTDYSGLATMLTTAGADRLVLAAGASLVLVGLAFKLGAFPVHPWVPDVAQGSPAPAAAFLTVVPKIGALVAITRFVSVIPDEFLAWRPLLAIVAALTMTLGNLAALHQEDVRRLLGWSSVSQAGYGLMAPVALGASVMALPALVTFIVGYAVANVAAFAVVISLRGRTTLDDYGGLAHDRPMHAAALTLAMLSLMGIPPLIGFGVKLALFGAAIDSGFTWLALLAVINTVVSLFYYLRVIGAMYLRDTDIHAFLLGRTPALTAAALALLVLAFGLAAQVFFELPADTLLLSMAGGVGNIHP